MISEMRSRADIIRALTTRFGNKKTLVEEFKSNLRRNHHSDKQRPVAATDYVTTALTKIKRMMRIATEEDLMTEHANIKPEEPVLQVMSNHPTLVPTRPSLGGCTASRTGTGFVRSEQVFEILNACLSLAEDSLLHIRTTHDVMGDNFRHCKTWF